MNGACTESDPGQWRTRLELWVGGHGILDRVTVGGAVSFVRAFHPGASESEVEAELERHALNGLLQMGRRPMVVGGRMSWTGTLSIRRW